MEAVEALYVGALRKVGVKDPVVRTIHMHGDATVEATDATLGKIESIPGVMVLSGITSDGAVRIFIPEVDAWLAQNTPFYTDEERAALKGSRNGESEAEKRKREEREESRKRIAELFNKRFGGAGLPPKADGGDTDAE